MRMLCLPLRYGNPEEGCGYDGNEVAMLNEGK